MSKIKNLYMIRQWDAGHGYNTLEFRIDYTTTESNYYQFTTLAKTFPPDTSQFYNYISISYQSNAATPSDWYGFNMEINTNHLDRYLEAVSLLKKIFKSSDLSNYKELIGYLDQYGQRYIYDPRLSENLINPMPAEFKPYHDDHIKVGKQYGYFRVLALNERDAVDKLNKKFKEAMSSRPYDDELEDYYLAWKAADCPAELCRGLSWQSDIDRLPDYRTIDQLLNCTPREDAIKHIPNYNINVENHAQEVNTDNA